MRKYSPTSAVWVVLWAMLAVAPLRSMEPAGSAQMTPEERTKVLQLLADSEKEFLESVESLSDEEWNFRHSPVKWSVGMVAEHIMLTEAALFASVEKALARDPNPDWEEKTSGKAEFIERVMPNRTRRAQAPVEVRPSGTLSRSEVIRRYKEQRARTKEFTRGTDRPLKSHTLDHPFPVFGTLSAYDWLIYIPLHNLRHNKQIAEVKSSPGYPR